MNQLRTTTTLLNINLLFIGIHPITIETDRYFLLYFTQFHIISIIHSITECNILQIISTIKILNFSSPSKKPLPHLFVNCGCYTTSNNGGLSAYGGCIIQLRVTFSIGF